MVKRKLPISKSPAAKAKPSETSNISGVKIKRILEHISTDDFMKFNIQDAKTKLSPNLSATEAKGLVKFPKTSKVKGITKKDKMIFKKQRLLKKFDAISEDLKKGLSRKGKKKSKTDETVKCEEQESTIEDKIIVNEIKMKKVKIDTTGNLKKSKKETKTKTVTFKKLLPIRKTEKSSPEKPSHKTTIFKKAKNNSSKSRQRNFRKGLAAYKKQMKKKDYVEDPIKAITERVHAFVRKETAV